MEKSSVKFRAYDHETGEMSYDFLERNWLKVAIHSPYVKLMQYTGLTDRQGEELWEEDLWQYHQVVYVVKWDPDNAKFYFWHPSSYATSDDYINLEWSTHGEKVGNFYEDHEVLAEFLA